ncbi:MAG: DUF1178 family protein [Pseudomonadota bacterium]
MIVYDLHCEHGHRFEGWFSSSSDYADQHEAGFVSCPECGSAEVSKAPMAPAVPAKSNTVTSAETETSQTVPMAPDGGQLSNTPMTAEMKQAITNLAEAQSKALKDSTWVGSKFAEQSREMHYGERDEAPIHGQASLEEAKSLVDEGVPIAPLPFPVAPPDKLN